MSDLTHLRSELQPLREQLIEHRVYRQLCSPEAMHVFMEHHVFAVWDFMSLLKSLQQRLTCVETPWRPGGSSPGCRLVNEIVLGEESDEDGLGGYASHFALYVASMREAGADTTAISTFIDEICSGNSWGSAMQTASVPPAVRRFVSSTFEIIESNDLCAVASAFTFGREDLLPDVFDQIVAELNSQTSGSFDRFLYYLQRHIELDGDQHGGMAHQLMEELCRDDAGSWQRALQAARESLHARLQLWDAVAAHIDARQLIDR